MNREWMYRRSTPEGDFSPHFLQGLESFIDFACSKPAFMDGENIRCPCRKCKNRYFRDVGTVRTHVKKNGFDFNYHLWVFQGERRVSEVDQPVLGGVRSLNQYREMVFDAGGSSYRMNYDGDDRMDDVEEPPNPEAQRFYDMLKAADNELWPGCTKHSQLSVVARLINMKSENNISERCFDQIAELMKEIVPENNMVPENFYRTKKLLSGMGLPVQKIDCCYHNCMLYWKGDSELEECRMCRYPRYKLRNPKKVPFKKMYYFPLTPRLQRLYASNATAKDMRWHASSVDDGIMRHPADSPAWKHLNTTFPMFASEIRNVRLGLSTDGFQPFGQTGKQYSSWPVIVTPYNLPPRGNVQVPSSDIPSPLQEDDLGDVTTVVIDDLPPNLSDDVFIEIDDEDDEEDEDEEIEFSDHYSSTDDDCI